MSRHVQENVATPVSRGVVAHIHLHIGGWTCPLRKVLLHSRIQKNEASIPHTTEHGQNDFKVQKFQTGHWHYPTTPLIHFQKTHTSSHLMHNSFLVNPSISISYKMYQVIEWFDLLCQHIACKLIKWWRITAKKLCFWIRIVDLMPKFLTIIKWHNQFSI